MTRLHPDLVAMADAVRILGPTRYVLLAREYEVQSDPGQAVILPERLADDLYESLYLRPSEPDVLMGRNRSQGRDFLASLSASNHGSGHWQSGWTVRRLPGDIVLVQAPEGVDFEAPRQAVRPLTGELAEGQACLVRVENELRHLSSGYYYALGDQEETELDLEPRPLWRFYWHVTAEGAAPLVAELTSALNAAAVPFRLKLLHDPSAYVRADAGVLYVLDRHVSRLGPMLQAAHEKVRPWLRPTVPMFALRLGDGLGLAVDREDASAGLERCRLVARAFWRSFERGEDIRTARLDRLEAEWRAAGLDPEAPHLGPGVSRDAVATLARELMAAPADGSRIAAGPAPSAKRSPLEAAHRIGRRICDLAHWDDAGQLCNWMGHSPLELQADGRIEPTVAALGDEFYGGSAGIALFLARLYEATGDPACRHTAIAAIVRSIASARSRPDRLRAVVSLYEGRLGVAFAGWSVGRVLGDEELAARALSLLPRVEDALTRSHPLDWLGGHAGAIPALLSVGTSEALTLALALGEELCNRATIEGEIWTWVPTVASGTDRFRVPLCGMSHGAAGFAVALLELYARTGRADFLEAARGSFAYEDSQFDAAAGRWPDLRLPTAASGQRDASSGRTWCHGAPGIALARLRAAALDVERSGGHHETARLALAATREAISRALDARRYDASPCHGLAGLLEAALVAGHRLADTSALDLAHEIAATLIARYDPDLDYPSGLPSGGPNPSLMVGLAGTGHAFLRLHNMSVPSVLVPWIDGR